MVKIYHNKHANLQIDRIKISYVIFPIINDLIRKLTLEQEHESTKNSSHYTGEKDSGNYKGNNYISFIYRISV